LGDLVIVPTLDSKFYDLHGFGIIIKVKLVFQEHRYTVLFTRSKRKIIFLRDGLKKHGD